MTRGRAIALAAIVLLAACTAPESDQGRREAAPPPAPPPRPLRQVLHANWAFESGSECIATAAAGRSSLRVTIGRHAPVRLVVSLGAASALQAGQAVKLRFNGPAGSWQVTAQQLGNRLLAVALGADDTALGRVLVLLSGGVMDIGEPDQGLPIISLPPSDAKGQLWFDCTRDKMI